MFEKDFSKLSSKFKFISHFHIGYSVLGKPLHVFKIGSGKRKIFICSGTHGNEWITSSLILRFIDDFCSNYINHFICEDFTIYFLPVVNPDGVNLVRGYFDKNSFIYINSASIAASFPDVPFPAGWKANIRGVDLNLQFPARLEFIKKN